MKVRAPAPIIVFAYKRVHHLRRTIESLRSNPLARDSHLVISCDGPKGLADNQLVAAVQTYAGTVEGFASLTVQTRTANLGLATSVVSGVTEMLTRHKNVIVLEDDLVLSRHFLEYMNDALALYEGDKRVASIHGYTYPTSETLPETFFLLGADCWGWATWARAWSHFNPDGTALRRALEERSLLRAFDFDGAYPYSKMLDEQIAGRNDSWAVRWHASCFLDELLTLYPGRSLVHNIGNDASGTHSGATDAFAQSVSQEPVIVRRQPLEPSADAQQAFKRYLSRERSLWGRLRGRWRGAVGTTT